MYSVVYESILFKPGMTIDTIELYILIPVLLTLTLIHGHRSRRKEKLQSQLLTKISIDLDGNILLRLVGVYSFYPFHSTFKGENPTYLISLKNKKT